MPFKTTDAKRRYDRERYLANRGTIRIHQAMRRANPDKTGSDVDNGYRRGRRNTIKHLMEFFKESGLEMCMNPAEQAEMARLTK